MVAWSGSNPLWGYASSLLKFSEPILLSAASAAKYTWLKSSHRVRPVAACWKSAIAVSVGPCCLASIDDIVWRSFSERIGALVAKIANEMWIVLVGFAYAAVLGLAFHEYHLTVDNMTVPFMIIPGSLLFLGFKYFVVRRNAAVDLDIAALCKEFSTQAGCQKRP